MKCFVVYWSDFNFVRFSSKKMGESIFDAKMGKFGDFIDRWNPIDGPLKDAFFTWSNFQIPPHFSKLDHFLGCSEWDNLFPEMYQVAIPKSPSNHIPILFEPFCFVCCSSPFKFEEMWFQANDFFYVVEEAWNSFLFVSSSSQAFALRLKKLKKTG